MRPFEIILCGLVCSLALPCSTAPVPWRQRLEKAYRREALGAQLKYIDGVLANRAPGYMVFAPTEQRMDLSVERDRFAQLFELANRVVLSTKIEKVEDHSNNAVCWREWTLQVEKKEPTTGSLYTEIITTRVVDQWCDLDGAPQMLASKLLSQKFSRGPQLEDDRLWPVRPIPVGKKTKARQNTRKK